MRIVVNGTARDVRPGITLAELLGELAVDPRRVAVAVNAAVIPRGEWAGRTLTDLERIEIIEAVGGG